MSICSLQACSWGQQQELSAILHGGRLRAAAGDDSGACAAARPAGAGSHGSNHACVVTGRGAAQADVPGQVLRAARCGQRGACPAGHGRACQPPPEYHPQPRLHRCRLPYLQPALLQPLAFFPFQTLSQPAKPARGAKSSNRSPLCRTRLWPLPHAGTALSGVSSPHCDSRGWRRQRCSLCCSALDSSR